MFGGGDSIEAQAGSELLVEWMEDIRRGVGKSAPAQPRDEEDEPVADEHEGDGSEDDGDDEET
jgi:hypothetical protein